jgi:hypothetical protein
MATSFANAELVSAKLRDPATLASVPRGAPRVTPGGIVIPLSAVQELLTVVAGAGVALATPVSRVPAGTIIIATIAIRIAYLPARDRGLTAEVELGAFRSLVLLYLGLARIGLTRLSSIKINARRGACAVPAYSGGGGT